MAGLELKNLIEELSQDLLIGYDNSNEWWQSIRVGKPKTRTESGSTFLESMDCIYKTMKAIDPFRASVRLRA